MASDIILASYAMVVSFDENMKIHSESQQSKTLKTHSQMIIGTMVAHQVESKVPLKPRAFPFHKERRCLIIFISRHLR